MKTLTIALCLAIGVVAEARTLQSPDFVADRFGRAVAFAGDVVVVGAPDGVADGAFGAGHVYLFDAGGAPVATIGLPPGETASSSDGLGSALAATATRIVVGVPGAAVGGNGKAGRALVFDASGAFVSELVPPDRTSGDGFGFAVAMLGSSFAVGAPGADAGAPDAGAVYVFGPQGTYQRKLTLHAAAEPGDALGFAVTGYGAAALLAGAPRPTLAARGAAFLFDVTTEAVASTYQVPEPNGGDRFGATVATVGPAVVVGAPVDPAHGDEAGSVHVFAGGDPDAGMPVYPATFSPELFGAALAADGDDVLVGMPLDSGGAGAVVRVQVATGDRLDTLRPLTFAGAGMFGAAIASRPGAIAVGAPGSRRVYVLQCGDSIRDPGEECDGDDDDGCAGHCITATCECGACGDGIVSGTEQCDDGNLAACDGCSPDCRIEHGQVCGDDEKRADCGEQCDDGGTQAGDGCSPDCRYECASPDDCLAHVPADSPIPPGVCTTATCTDGTCAFTIAPRGTSCGNALGCPLVCDGDGSCVISSGTLDCCEVCECCVPTCVTDDDCRSADPCLGLCSDGTCFRLPKPAGARCIDDNLCDDDRCDAAGTCIKDATQRVCPDDGDFCTADFCEPPFGCVYELKTCDDGNACTVDRCNPATGECEITAVGAPIVAIAAGAPNACYQQACNQPPVFICDDNDPCTTDVCVNPFTGECANVHTENCCHDSTDCPGETCRVGSRCDTCERCGVLSYGEACCELPGPYRAQCTGGELVVGGACDRDASVCTTDVCTQNGCTAAGELACDDNNVCTTTAPCDPAGGCSYTPVQGPIKCGRPCWDDRCNGASCAEGVYLCEDNNPCTDDTCEADGCHHSPKMHCCKGDADCHDSNACTINERCVDETCVWDDLDCSPADSCENADCSPIEGCVRVPKNESESCEPSGPLDACDNRATCASGECVEDHHWCRIDVSKRNGVVAGKACAKKARKAVEITVSCLALNDGPIPRAGRKRASCSAVAKTADGTAVTRMRSHRLDKNGRAELRLHLSNDGRKALCAQGSLVLDVEVRLKNRQGTDLAVTRPTAISASGSVQ